MILTKSILHEKLFLSYKVLTVSKVLLIKCKTLEIVNEEWKRNEERVKATQTFKIWGGGGGGGDLLFLNAIGG